MATSKVTYVGNLRTEAKHLRSGTQIITDAPVDNQGKGEAFSPTDLTSTALAACMVTIMGIRARDKGLAIEGVETSITKTMASNPRRISKIEVTLKMPAGNYSSADKKVLEAAATTCPVAMSLHPDIEQVVIFEW